MLKHVVHHKNTRIVFGDKQAAQNHIAKFPEYSYSEINEWEYFAPRYQNSTTRYRSIMGGSLVDAIEKNFEQITKDVGFYGSSGYTLDRVTLIDNKDGTATLKIAGWSFSDALVGFAKDMLSDGNKRHINVEINGVVDGDVPNGSADFELKKSK